MKHNLTNMIKRKWSAAVLLCAMMCISSSAWAGYILYGTSDNISSWSNNVSTSGSGPYTATLSGLTAKAKYFIAYSSSTSYTDVSKSAASIGTTSGLQNSGTQEHDGYRFVWFETSSATSVSISVTTGMEYSITANSCTAPTVVTTNGATGVTSLSATVGGTITNGTCTVNEAGIAYGKSTNPTSGVSASYTSGTAFSVNLTALEAETRYYYRAYATTASGTTYGTEYTFDTTASAEGTPTVRIGAKPTVSESDCSVTVNAYLSQTGCSPVNGMTLYYSNNRSFRTDGGYKTQSKTLGTFPTAINNSQSVVLTSEDVNSVVSPGETMYVRLSASNNSGTSPYSDIVPVPYSCGKFVKQNLAKSFKACPGEHQFTWSDMFISPTPATWSCTLGGNDATSDFTLKDGEMIWNTEGKEETSYTYTFTARKDGYDDATATLEITYTVPVATTGTISELTATPSSTTPWTAVALSATGTTNDITKIYWTVQPDAEISEKSGDTLNASATFKAEAKTSTITYKVIVSGYNSTCGSVSKDVEIIVSPDTTETLCN